MKGYMQGDQSKQGFSSLSAEQPVLLISPSMPVTCLSMSQLDCWMSSEVSGLSGSPVQAGSCRVRCMLSKDMYGSR